MQDTLKASSLTPRTAKSVTSKILKDPATVQDLLDFVGKAVVTSMVRLDVQRRSTLHMHHAPPTAHPPDPNPIQNPESRSERKKHYTKKKQKHKTDTDVTGGDH